VWEWNVQKDDSFKTDTQEQDDAVNYQEAEAVCSELFKKKTSFGNEDGVHAISGRSSPSW
jgi:hypothetical protein